MNTAGSNYFSFCVMLPILVGLIDAQVPITTRSVDNRRSGSNTRETLLKPGNVAQLKFLRELKIDGDDDPRLEAQPLYMPAIQMDNGPHNVVIVCTMGNNVYAFDVETSGKLWKTPLGRAVAPKPNDPVTGRPLPLTANGLQPTDIDMFGINGTWGVLSTPVIDTDTNTLYVVSWSSLNGATESASFHLHALNLRDGTPAKPPIAISAAAGGAAFDPHLQKQRSALLLLRTPFAGGVRKTLFMACGITDETAAKHHGWIVAFDVRGNAMREVAAFCTTPNSQGGGIWQAGQGPSADADGFLYVMTGNGGWNGTTDFSESLLKLRYAPPANPSGQGTLTVVDWFTPFRDADRGRRTGNTAEVGDQDLGSAGPVLSTGPLVAAAGKDGVLFVFDRHTLGKMRVDPAQPQLAHYQPALKTAVFYTYFPGFQLNALDINDLDTIPTGHTHHLHGSSVIWDSQAHGTMLFVWGENSALRAWSLSADGTAKFLAASNETASAFATSTDAMPGGMLALTANNDHDGILWGTTPLKGNWRGHDNQGDANKEVVEGVIRAYDASSFGPPLANGDTSLKLLWESTTPGNPQATDRRFTFDKFCPPVIADGRVLVTTYDGRVLVYGL